MESGYTKKKRKPGEVTSTSCRVCLKACIEDDEDIKVYSDRYSFCTGFEIRDEDIPRKVCTGCANSLKKVWSFLSKCRRTESRLAEFMNEFHEFFSIAPKDEESENVQVLVKVEPELEVFLEEDATPVAEEKPKVAYTGSICDQCGLHFNDRTAFRQHYNQHFKSGDIPKMFCDICMQKTHQRIGFTNKERLVQHMEKHHLRAKRQRPCPHCGRLFNNTNTMQCHIYRQHVDPKDYKYECLVCQKRFFKRHLLKIHHRGHTGEKMYTCHICGAKFSMPQHCRIHIANIHNPTQKSCEFCGKTFTSQKYLNQHLLTHNQGCYVCPLCPTKAFSLTTTLRSHMKTNHPTFPLPPPGTKLKNFDWGKMLGVGPPIVLSSIPTTESFNDVQ